jgi:hypothetical protein
MLIGFNVFVSSVIPNTSKQTLPTTRANPAQVGAYQPPQTPARDGHGPFRHCSFSSIFVIHVSYFFFSVSFFSFQIDFCKCLIFKKYSNFKTCRFKIV